MKGTSSTSSTRQIVDDGFIVVAVLWILGTLSALVSIYTVYVINTASGFAVHDQRLHAEAWVSAAIELTAYRQLTARALSRPTRGQFNFQLGQADIAVEFQSETARIDLNTAPKQLLAGLFLALGEHRDRAEIYSDRIVGWRTAPTSSQDPEGSAYRAARLGYGPRGAKFPHASELSLVRDLPMSVVERVLPFVTVYSGRPQINVFDAAPEVIAALPGMTQERLDAVLKHLHGPIALVGCDGQAAPRHLTLQLAEALYQQVAAQGHARAGTHALMLALERISNYTPPATGA
jgi:general secretion pathway protein K